MDSLYSHGEYIGRKLVTYYITKSLNVSDFKLLLRFADLHELQYDICVIKILEILIIVFVDNIYFVHLRISTSARSICRA